MRRLLATQFNYCWNAHNGKLIYFSYNHHSPTFSDHVIIDAPYLDSTWFSSTELYTININGESASIFPSVKASEAKSIVHFALC